MPERDSQVQSIAAPEATVRIGEPVPRLYEVFFDGNETMHVAIDDSVKLRNNRQTRYTFDGASGTFKPNYLSSLPG